MVSTAIESTPEQASRPKLAAAHFFEKSGKIEPALISTLQQNPWQPRLSIDPTDLEALKQSIRDFGFIGYIPVRRADERDPMSPLQIVYGHRRVRAAEMTGMKSVPVMLCKVSDEAMMRLAFVENATQKKMTYWEEALHFAEMQTTLSLSLRKLADMLGLSKGYVHNRLALLALSIDDPVRRAAEANEIAMSNALAFMNLSKVLEADQMESLLDDVRHGRLTLDDLSALQKALQAAMPDNAEVTDDGQRVKVASLIDQARQKELVQPRLKVPTGGDSTVKPMDRHQEATWLDAAKRAEQAEREWNAIAGDLPSGPALERAGAMPLSQMIATTNTASAPVTVARATIEPPTEVERGPIKYASSNFTTKTGHDWARMAIDQLEGFYPNLLKSVERADFTLLTQQERHRLVSIIATYDTLRKEHDDFMRKLASGE